MCDELKTLARRLARRKHRLSWLIGFSDCGNFAIWRGMMYGNEWRTSLSETRALVRNGARKSV
jgi:hypothetical protein